MQCIGIYTLLLELCEISMKDNNIDGESRLRWNLTEEQRKSWDELLSGKRHLSKQTFFQIQSRLLPSEDNHENMVRLMLRERTQGLLWRLQNFQEIQIWNWETESLFTKGDHESKMVRLVALAFVFLAEVDSRSTHFVIYCTPGQEMIWMSVFHPQLRKSRSSSVLWAQNQCNYNGPSSRANMDFSIIRLPELRVYLFLHAQKWPWVIFQICNFARHLHAVIFIRTLPSLYSTTLIRGFPW